MSTLADPRLPHDYGALGEYVLQVLQEEFARVGLRPQFKPLEI